jgi:hypothetical protein
MLVHQIESELHKRLGNIQANFDTTINFQDSELVRQVFKDPYKLDVRHGALFYILGLTKGILERKYPSQPVHLESKGEGESSILVKRCLEIKCSNQRVARLVGYGESYTA